MNRSSSNLQLNSPHRSSDAESETDKTVYEGEDIVYLSGPSFNLEYVNSQVKLLEAKLNHEKLNFNKMFSDMQSHYKGRLSELEGKLEASKARNSELEKLEGKLRASEAENMQVKELVAEKTKLENYNSKLQSQLEIHKYKLQQSEKKRQLDQENGKNLLNKVNKQLQDEKMVSKDLVKKLAATQLQKEELMKLVDEKELANTVVQKELQEVRTNNQNWQSGKKR
uniref:Uncharacterized protein n=1 Tax=Ditylenchus dipsaci TaxID=166011 RepID=A0A915E7A5_9BILA